MLCAVAAECIHGIKEDRREKGKAQVGELVSVYRCGWRALRRICSRWRMMQDRDRGPLARRHQKVFQTNGKSKGTSDSKIYVHMFCETTTNQMAISTKFPCCCTMGEILTWWAKENSLNPDIVTMTMEGEVVSLKDTLGQVQKKAKGKLKKKRAESVDVFMQPADGRVALKFRADDFLAEGVGIHHSGGERKQAKAAK